METFARINLRLPVDLQVALSAIANTSRRSLTAEIVTRLWNSLPPEAQQARHRLTPEMASLAASLGDRNQPSPFGQPVPAKGSLPIELNWHFLYNACLEDEAALELETQALMHQARMNTAYRNFLVVASRENDKSVGAAIAHADLTQLVRSTNKSMKELREEASQRREKARWLRSQTVLLRDPPPMPAPPNRSAEKSEQQQQIVDALNRLGHQPGEFRGADQDPGTQK